MNSIDINKEISQVESLLKKEDNLSPALETSINMLLLVVKLLVDSKGLNSRNSSKPPSSDPNREKTSRAKKEKSKGGQHGHKGHHLEKVDEPDEVKNIKLDRRTLPRGEYAECGYESRQVFNIKISRHVIEYRAQVLEDVHGNRFTATFPGDAMRQTQYGNSIKANAVYMSMYQLIPYERTQIHFDEIFGIPLSTGSLVNFNLQAYQKLDEIEGLAVKMLRDANTIHADETGVNVNGKRLWLHNASNEKWTLLSAHKRRGCEAMNEIGVLPAFSGLLIHDHWKSYYRYKKCTHSLCNAHHKRELTRAHEQDNQQWAAQMETLLDELNEAVKVAGGVLKEKDREPWVDRYRAILKEGEIECPPPIPEPDSKKKRGKLARSKFRNLLERLQNFEGDVLRFMNEVEAPFTNNQGERDLRMAKVQQKISGCFRSMQGAKVYCRIRSYISTCQKHGVGVGEALELLFADKWPSFIQDRLDILGDIAE